MYVPRNLKRLWRHGRKRSRSGKCFWKPCLQEKAEEMKERLEDFASAQEKRAYIQGYADCVQALYHMGLLKENEGLKWAEKMDVH